MAHSGSLRAAGLLVVVGLMVVVTVACAQQQDEKPHPTVHSPGAGRVVVTDGEKDPDFELWKRKAELELEILQAQVDAKKAEIRRREAEHHLGRITPDVAILEKLEKRVSPPFAEETPLEDVLKFIKSASSGPHDKGIPIYIDPVGLQEAEKTLTSPVTIDLQDVPLKTVLRLVLKQLGLAFKVEDGLLTIDAEH